MADILIVDDETAIADLVEVCLQNEGFTVHKFYNACDALACVESRPLDLAILDVMLPDMDGFALCQKIRQNHLFPIIMLTARVEDMDKIMGLTLGADDYITKPFSPKELIARIKAVLRRRAPQLTDDVISIGNLQLDPSTHRLSSQGMALTIGPTEFRLLHFFMTHTERVFTRSQLLDQVWGDHVFVEERTVDVHIRRLRKALEPSGHDKHIETIRGSGYRFALSPLEKAPSA